MPLLSFRKLIIASFFTVALANGVIDDTLLEDFKSIRERWRINSLTIIQEGKETDCFTDAGWLESHIKFEYESIFKALKVNVIWSDAIRTFDGEPSIRGAIWYPYSKSKTAPFIEKLIAWSSSSRPLFLCSLRDTSLPAWLRKTRIPFTTNVYVILQDAQQPGTLTLQGVYHLHEESDQLTVDLVGRRALQGPNTRWTFFGPKYNTIRRADLRGIKIRTVIPKVMFDTTDHGLGSFFRATEPLVILLMKALNASMVPVILGKGPNVGFRIASSGAWTGMIGLLQRGEADFSLVGTDASGPILEQIDLTCPFLGQVFRLFVRRPEFIYSLSTCVKGFTTTLWIAISFTLVLLAISMAIASRFASRYKFDKGSDDLDLSEGALRTIGTCCLQGWGRLTKTAPGYLICLSTLIFGYLINLFYVSQLQAVVMAKIAPLPFRDLDGLLDTGTYVPGINRGTTPFVIAQTATNGTMKRVRDVMTRRPKDVLMSGLTSSIHRVCSEKLALLAWKININSELRKAANCTVVDTKVSMFPVFIAFGVSKGYPYKHTLNFFIRRLAEGGMVNHFITERLTRVKGDDVSSFSIIELDQVIPFLMLYAVALAVSTAILFLEILFGSRRHQR